MSYQIYNDINNMIAEWVCKGLGFNIKALGENLTFGFAYDNRMVGGLIFHNLRPHGEVWWTIYTTEKYWCNRGMLKKMFAMAFIKMNCRRISILVRTDNQPALKLVQRLGFKQEGCLRKFSDTGEDCYILGMLREECPWINFNGDKK